MYGNTPEAIEMFKQKLKDIGLSNKKIERLYFIKEKIKKYQAEIDDIFKNRKGKL